MRANPRGLFRSFALAALAAAWLLAGAARAAEADLRLAKDYFHAQRYSDALVSLRKVLKDDPESVDGNYYMGLVYLENKKASTARNFFLRALQLDPSRDDAADKAIQTLRAEARGSAARRRRVLEHPVRK